MSEFHVVGGKYDINDKWIGIDFANSFLQHPEQLEAIVIHETVHAIIAGTDYGQASHVIFRSSKHFQHLSKQESSSIEKLIFFSQDFVQEGLATYMQMAHIVRVKDRAYARDWADQHLPVDYKKKLKRLEFLFKMSKRYRDMFTNKAYRIAMDNGFQQDAPKFDLLKNPEQLKGYLQDTRHNPNLRLEALIETISLNQWLVTKSPLEIAEKAGLELHDVATKQEGAAFATYVASLTDKPRTFRAKDIGDPLPDESLREQALDSLMVTNLNLNLAENSEVLFNKKDFLYYADVIDSVFVNYHDETWSKRQTIREVINENPDLALIAFTKTGEKYTFYCSKETATSIFANELRDASLMVKWGGYAIEKNRFIWSDEARPPDVIWYNSPKHIKQTFEAYVQKHPGARLRRLHISATQDHPLQTLFILEESYNTLHVANDFGNVRIAKAIGVISKNSIIIESSELRPIKQHINNFFVQQGMHRTVDWVETMIVQNGLILRTE